MAGTAGLDAPAALSPSLNLAPSRRTDAGRPELVLDACPLHLSLPEAAQNRRLAAAGSVKSLKYARHCNPKADGCDRDMTVVRKMFRLTYRPIRPKISTYSLKASEITSTSKRVRDIVSVSGCDSDAMMSDESIDSVPKPLRHDSDRM